MQNYRDEWYDDGYMPEYLTDEDYYENHRPHTSDDNDWLDAWDHICDEQRDMEWMESFKS